MRAGTCSPETVLGKPESDVGDRPLLGGDGGTEPGPPVGHLVMTRTPGVGVVRCGEAPWQQTGLSAPRTPSPWSVTRAAGSARSSRTSRVRSGMAMRILRAPRTIFPGVGRDGRLHDGPGFPHHDRSSSRSRCQVILVTAAAWLRSWPGWSVPRSRPRSRRPPRTCPPRSASTTRPHADAELDGSDPARPPPTWIRGSDPPGTTRRENWRTTSSHVPPRRTRQRHAGLSGCGSRRLG